MAHKSYSTHPRCARPQTMRRHTAWLLAAAASALPLTLGGCPQMDDVQPAQDAPAVPGPQGLQGLTGEEGERGAPGIPGNPGTPGALGLSCWDLNGDGLGTPNEDLNGDGNFNALDCQGTPGLDGQDGQDGLDGQNGQNGLDGQNGQPGLAGLACWDLNGNGIAEANEDTNNDGNFDALDCQGAPGQDGNDGQNGQDGASPFELIGNDAVYTQGNVGIGTETPSATLDVVGSVEVTGDVLVDGTIFANAISSNSSLLLQTAGTTRIFVDDSTGNVGIGTAAPAAKLHVVQSTNGNAVILPGLRTEQTDTTPNVIGGASDNTVSSATS